jgi:FAD synthetase
MCFGTFDILHLGHLNYFEQAKKHGDRLLVVIARDSTKKNQHKETIFNEKERLKLVESLKIVDKAVLGNHKDHFKIIEELNPNIICLGYDHPITKETLEQELMKRNLKPHILRMNPYKENIHKASKIKEKVLGVK